MIIHGFSSPMYSLSKFNNSFIVWLSCFIQDSTRSITISFARLHCMDFIHVFVFHCFSAWLDFDLYRVILDCGDGKIACKMDQVFIFWEESLTVYCRRCIANTCGRSMFLWYVLPAEAILNFVFDELKIFSNAYPHQKGLVFFCCSRTDHLKTQTLESFVHLYCRKRARRNTGGVLGSHQRKIQALSPWNP
jgi:hypothetical protein